MDKRLSVAVHHKSIEPYLDVLQARQHLKALLQKTHNAKVRMHTASGLHHDKAAMTRARQHHAQHHHHHQHHPYHTHRQHGAQQLSRSISAARPVGKTHQGCDRRSTEHKSASDAAANAKPLTIASLLVSSPVLPPSPASECASPKLSIPWLNKARAVAADPDGVSPQAINIAGEPLFDTVGTAESTGFQNLALLPQAKQPQLQPQPQSAAARSPVALTELEKHITILGQPLAFGALERAGFAAIL